MEDLDVTTEVKQMAERDAMAFFILKDFIRDGFPLPDPDKQVALAYLYADSIIRFKHAEQQMLAIGQICPKCGKNMERINVGTLDDPGQTLMVCPGCKGGM